MQSDFRSVLIVRSTISFSTSELSTEAEFNEAKDTSFNFSQVL